MAKTGGEKESYQNMIFVIDQDYFTGQPAKEKGQEQNQAVEAEGERISLCADEKKYAVGKIAACLDE